jgi:hypothetical protein
MLKGLTNDIIYKHASYSNFSNAYNALFNNKSVNNNERNCLQYKRLCEAWLYYNLLTFIKEENGILFDYNAPFIQDLDSELKRLKDSYYSLFKRKWMNHINGKQCKHPNCSVALNLDGDHKVTRLTCLYNKNMKKTNEFNSEALLSCPETPVRKSYYCEAHINEDKNLDFMIDGKAISINLQDIKPTCMRKLKKVGKNDMKIHDTFLDENGTVLYLVTCGGKLYWLEEKNIDKEILVNFLSFWGQSNAKDSESICKIRKDLDNSFPCKNKTRTKGVLLGVFNCGIIGAYSEIFNDESLFQVSLFVLDMLYEVPNFIIYDDACHLHPYLMRHQNLLDVRLKKLEKIKFSIDRLHIHNHTRKICQEYNSDKHKELKGINSVVCEETNYWFSGFKHIMKHMNYERFNFYLYIIFNSYNEEKIQLNKVKKYKKTQITTSKSNSDSNSNSDTSFGSSNSSVEEENSVESEDYSAKSISASGFGILH